LRLFVETPYHKAISATPKHLPSAAVAGCCVAQALPTGQRTKGGPCATHRPPADRSTWTQATRFKHFDHVRKRLTIFAKGGKVRNLPIPDPAFWHDLGRLILDSQAEPHDFLMQRTKGNGAVRTSIPDKPMGAHGMHTWWYRCLERAGVVTAGTTRGERMHKARHSAGQRLLDHTGNLKAVQQLLGHASIATTGDIYVGWDEEQLAASLEDALKRESEWFPAAFRKRLLIALYGDGGNRTRVRDRARASISKLSRRLNLASRRPRRRARPGGQLPW
jgi:hypothetical protein